MKNVLLDAVLILFEDEDYIVVNKPSGLSVHSDGKTNEQTLVDWILKKYPKSKKVGEPLALSSGEIIFRPGIVHRIDKETSGVLLIAKNQEAYVGAKKQFQNHSVKKIYNAFVYGELKKDVGVIDRAIGRSKNDFRKWTAQRGSRGEMREAVTNYTVLKRSKGFTYVEVCTLTGRTHQIRVHFKAINHPVVCDKLYAPGLSKNGEISDKPQSFRAENKEPALGFTRLALHAKSIDFNTIKGNIIVKVEAPLPKDFVFAHASF